MEAPAFAVDVAETRALVSEMRSARLGKLAPKLPESAWERVAAGEVVTGTEAGDGLGTGWALAIVDHRVEDLWVALNTEELHVGRFDVLVSEAVAGDFRSSGRRVYQVIDMPRMFSDRWVCVDESFGADVFARSKGKMWELAWTDATELANLGGRTPPDGSVPVGSTAGGWLLVPISEGRTVVEVHGALDPGGAVPASMATRVAASALAASIRDLDSLTTELSGRSRKGYVRPDGSAL